jgi:uncharacterized protein YegP (UPF0339 family)
MVSSAQAGQWRFRFHGTQRHTINLGDKNIPMIYCSKAVKSNKM